jgi:hypothetical protein
MNPATAPRSRRQLLLLMLVFALPIAVAAALSLAGWRPPAASNHGQLIEPAQDFNGAVATAADGSALRWNNADGMWRIVVRAPDDCGEPCARMVDSLQRVWIGLTGDAAHAEVLWAGRPDAATGAALARFPQARVVMLDTNLLPPPAAPLPGDTLAPLAVWLVDPNGYLALRYDAGFDPIGLRADLRKLIR